jgi:hypothetical protein
MGKPGSRKRAAEGVVLNKLNYCPTLLLTVVQFDDVFPNILLQGTFIGSGTLTGNLF